MPAMCARCYEFNRTGKVVEWRCPNPDCGNYKGKI